jgi:hypothetical protein
LNRKVKNVETISDLHQSAFQTRITEMVAARVQAVMASQIGRGKSVYIPGVSCIEILIQLRNIMAASATPRRMKKAIMNIDLEKASDRVDHRYHH